MSIRLPKILHSLLFIILIILLTSYITSAQSHVGVSSTLVDMGTLERGSENIARFNIVTSSAESFLVSLNKEPATKDFFSRTGYNDHLLNYSEEGVMSWVELFDNYVEVESLKEKAGIIGAQKEVNFVINVPENAEPGYHIFRIKPIPVLPPDSIGQVGARIVSVTSVTFLLNVDGVAVRDGIILDVLPSIVSNRLVTDTYFQNTGTTTITAFSTQELYKDGKFIAKSTSAKELVAPGDVKVIKTPFQSSFPEGEYDVWTTVDFLTGYTSKNSTISLMPEVLPPVEKPEEKAGTLVWIIILIVIVAIAILIYKW